MIDTERPTKLTGLRSFLGACNFFRVFVPNYSVIASDLVKLTKSTTNAPKDDAGRFFKDAAGAEIKTVKVDVKNDWDEKHDKAFKALKLAISTAGALTAYDPAREAIIQVDSCRLGVGAMLAQRYGAQRYGGLARASVELTRKIA